MKKGLLKTGILLSSVLLLAACGQSQTEEETSTEESTEQVESSSEGVSTVEDIEFETEDTDLDTLRTPEDLEEASTDQVDALYAFIGELVDFENATFTQNGQSQVYGKDLLLNFPQGLTITEDKDDNAYKVTTTQTVIADYEDGERYTGSGPYADTGMLSLNTVIHDGSSYINVDELLEMNDLFNEETPMMEGARGELDMDAFNAKLDELRDNFGGKFVKEEGYGDIPESATNVREVMSALQGYLNDNKEDITFTTNGEDVYAVLNAETYSELSKGLQENEALAGSSISIPMLIDNETDEGTNVFIKYLPEQNAMEIRVVYYTADGSMDEDVIVEYRLSDNEGELEIPTNLVESSEDFYNGMVELNELTYPEVESDELEGEGAQVQDGGVPMEELDSADE